MTDHGGPLTPQLVIGVLVATAGVLLTLDNLNVIQAERYLRFWPAGLIALGLVKLTQSRSRQPGALGGVVLVATGSWLLLEQTAVVEISVRQLWPALLVLFGGFLVWRGLSGPPALAAGDSNATVSATAVLGSVVRGNNSPGFRGGELTAVMGGCEIDLRHAAIHGEAVIDVFAMWVGIEIRVPDDWTVVSRVTPVLGGVDDQTRPPQTASRHRLVLRGLVMMAGVEIKN
jgi:Domain of unknown function (DUF5668)